ncbi:MAG: hypothetical protein HYV97_08420 [Bdellovibrio sp.]|nr:hypothetical protein [Bdellovibrio sp.]
MTRLFLCYSILFAFILCLSSWQSAFASTAKCEEALRNADLLVRDVRLGCESLKQCLVRRDTCIPDGLPNTRSKCEAVDECMGNRDGDFGDAAQCRYQWSEFSGKLKCNLKRRLFAAQERCPGRILVGMGGLSLMLTLGLTFDYAVDTNYNCEAVNLYFKSLTRSLDRAREGIIRFCREGRDRAAAFQTPVCTESQDFKLKSDGQYALAPGASNGTHINESRDGSGSGHEGGGEESGGGGGPKSKAR